jgi:fucose permease
LIIYVSSIERARSYQPIHTIKGTTLGSGSGDRDRTGPSRISNNGIVRDGSFNSRYRLTEIFIALMLFSFVGGGVTATAYVIHYANETAVVAADLKDKVFLVLWVFITFGRLLGIYIQRSLDLYKLLLVMACLSLGGCASMALICHCRYWDIVSVAAAPLSGSEIM